MMAHECDWDGVGMQLFMCQVSHGCTDLTTGLVKQIEAHTLQQDWSRMEADAELFWVFVKTIKRSI